MFENIANFFRKLVKTEPKQQGSKDTAKERLHLVLMQDRANVSADFLDLMKQEIIEVIKKYIEVEESAIDVRLTNEIGDDGSKGAPSLYANIPILNIKHDMKKEDDNNEKETLKKEELKDKDQNNESKKEDNKQSVEKNLEEKVEEKTEEAVEENNEEEKNMQEDKEKTEEKSIDNNQKEDNKTENE